MFCGKLGADSVQGRLTVDQQQQEQQYLTEQLQEGVASMACGSIQGTGHISSVVPSCAFHAVQTDAVVAELENADCNPPREQPQRPVLASLPSNQLLDAATAGTALSSTGACLLIMTT